MEAGLLSFLNNMVDIRRHKVVEQAVVVAGNMDGDN